MYATPNRSAPCDGPNASLFEDHERPANSTPGPTYGCSPPRGKYATPAGLGMSTETSVSHAGSSGFSSGHLPCAFAATPKSAIATAHPNPFVMTAPGVPQDAARAQSNRCDRMSRFTSVTCAPPLGRSDGSVERSTGCSSGFVDGRP